MTYPILILVTFSFALAIGVFLGKLLFNARSQSDKSGLEERINGLLEQIEQFKNQTRQQTLEKENLQKEK